MRSERGVEGGFVGFVVVLLMEIRFDLGRVVVLVLLFCFFFSCSFWCLGVLFPVDLYKHFGHPFSCSHLGCNQHVVSFKKKHTHKEKSSLQGLALSPNQSFCFESREAMAKA